MKGVDWMPNWTTNKIICKKSIGDKILSKDNEDYILDFNKIIPMPDELQIEAGSRGQRGLMYLYSKTDSIEEKEIINKAYKSLNPFFKDIYKDSEYVKIDNNITKYEEDNNFKESIELGEKYLSNYKKHGHCHWYDWCVSNWGTKWNVLDEVDVSYDEKTDEYEINFDTAWSVPAGIVSEYSKLCSDEEFFWKYENEDYDGVHILSKIGDEIIDSVYHEKESEVDGDYEYE